MKKIFSLFIILAVLLTAVPLTASAEEKDDYIKILLIGNSYSDDAADGGYFLQDAYCQSMLYKIIKSMVGDGCKVDIGLCWSGGVSLGWHATKAKSGAAEYTFLNISDDTNGRWQILGSSDVSSKYALEYTDWDVVVLQPYGQEVRSKTGKSSESTVSTAFRQLSGSVPYMLDYVAEHAPGAEVYLYQIFVMYSTPVDVLTKTAKEFGYIQANTIAAESCTGTNSGKKIAGIIPVGTAVQNARSTYLNDLWNGAEAIANSTIDPIYDPMEGLLRDRCHLTFNVGRYIANLTFAEKLIPEEMRTDGCELPDMRPSEVVGELPREYVDVAKACVDAAIESEKATSGRLNAVTIGKYAAPFSDETLAALDGVEVKASGVHTPAELRAAVKKAYEDILGERITVNFTDEDAIEAFSFSDSDGKAELTVPTTVRYGYSEIAADVSVSLSCPHTDVETAEAVAPTCISTGHGAYEKCTVCGTLLSGSDEILPMTDHTPGEAATCTEPQICTFCKAELAPAKGHVPGEAATCTEPQICTVCKTELVPAKGHKFGPDATCTEPQVCLECGAELKSENGHVPGAPATCTEPQECLVCHTELTPAKGHDFSDEWTVDVPAAYDSAGSKSHHCRECGEKTDVTEIPQLVDTSALYTDVKESSWFRGSVDYAVGAGLMNGTSADKFTPNGPMTRAMLVTVLWRLEGSPETSVKVPFTDLKQDWYKTAVAWAYENEIVNGTAADKFSPNGAITREQMAAILFRYSEYRKYDVSARGTIDTFPDAGKVHDYAEDAISWAVGEGLIGGVAKNGTSYLDPRGSATRAQVATILQRFCEKH